MASIFPRPKVTIPATGRASDLPAAPAEGGGGATNQERRPAVKPMIPPERNNTPAAIARTRCARDPALYRWLLITCSLTRDILVNQTLLGGVLRAADADLHAGQLACVLRYGLDNGAGDKSSPLIRRCRRRPVAHGRRPTGRRPISPEMTSILVAAEVFGWDGNMTPASRVGSESTQAACPSLERLAFMNSAWAALLHHRLRRDLGEPIEK